MSEKIGFINKIKSVRVKTVVMMIVTGIVPVIVITAFAIEQYRKALRDCGDLSNEQINLMVGTLAKNIGIVIAVLIIIIIALIGASYFYSGVPYRRMREHIRRLDIGIDDKGWRSGCSEMDKLSESVDELVFKLQKLNESRDEFVSNVSHELKTPMTSIKILADSLMCQENVPAEMYREFMEDIASEIERENSIIDDLLALVRMNKTTSELNISEANITDIVDTVIKRVTPMARRRHLEITFESFKPVVAEVDEVKMTMAVTNLIENAIKYNVLDGWVKISLNADLNFFYLKVADSGIGIPEEVQTLVFDRFYRVDKARSRETGGTGLGLAIANSVINMHQGEIKLYSKEGEGSVFTLRVPLYYVPNPVY